MVAARNLRTDTPVQQVLTAAPLLLSRPVCLPVRACRHAGASSDVNVLPSWTTLAAGSLVTATALQALIKAWGKGSSSRSGR